MEMSREMLKRTLTYMIRRKRPRGRPRKRWNDSIKKLLEKIEGDWEQAYDRVMDGISFGGQEFKWLQEKLKKKYFFQTYYVNQTS